MTVLSTTSNCTPACGYERWLEIVGHTDHQLRAFHAIAATRPKIEKNTVRRLYATAIGSFLMTFQYSLVLLPADLFCLIISHQQSETAATITQNPTTSLTGHGEAINGNIYHSTAWMGMSIRLSLFTTLIP